MVSDENFDLPVPSLQHETSRQCSLHGRYSALNNRHVPRRQYLRVEKGLQEAECPDFLSEK